MNMGAEVSGRMATEAAGEFAEFAAAEIGALTRFAGVLTGDRHLAHDVLTDALIAASARWHRIGSLDQPAAYVRRMVVTTFLAHERRERRRRPDPTADNGVFERSQSDATATMDARLELAVLIQQLPQRQRAAVVMRYYLDLPDSEIAAALDCPASTVRTLVSRALVRMRVASGASTSDENGPTSDDHTKGATS